MARIVYGVVGAALATLVAGFFIQSSSLPLLVSIGFSLVAAVLILAGWARRIRLEDEVLFDEPEVVWDIDEPSGEPELADVTSEITVVATEPPRAKPRRARPQRPPEPHARPEERPRVSRSRPAAAKKSTVATRSNKSVVVIPGRSRYHTADCRFASNPAAETVKEREAVARGLEACSVCRA